MLSILQGSRAAWKVLNFLMTWKVLETQFAPGKSWKLKVKVLESYGIYLCFQLRNMPSRVWAFAY